MNSKVVATLALALFLFGGSASFAVGTCSGCKIKNLGSGPYYDALCGSGSCVFVAVEPTVGGKPGCASNTYWDFALDTSTASGKATYALILTAYAAGQNISISGANTCSFSPGGAIENLYWINYAP